VVASGRLGTQTLLANVGTVHFGPTSTYTSGGAQKDVARGNPTKILLSPGGVVNEATPSSLAANGQSFNDCAYSRDLCGSIGTLATAES
jgi:hypothetical protein